MLCIIFLLLLGGILFLFLRESCGILGIGWTFVLCWLLYGHGRQERDSEGSWDRFVG